MATSSKTVMRKNGSPKYIAAQKPANQVGRGSRNLYPITAWPRRIRGYVDQQPESKE